MLVYISVYINWILGFLKTKKLNWIVQNRTIVS
jgi:hypothetical protein